MKFHKKHFTISYWLAFLRRQPKHMQHVFSLVVSGLITAILGAAILYFEYGFWHERYSAREVVVEEKKGKDPENASVSPGAMIGSFFNEATQRVKTLKDQKNLLEGKELYIKESGPVEMNTESTQPQTESTSTNEN